VTPAVLDRPASLFAEPAGAAGPGVAGPATAAERLGGGRVTLEERLNLALQEARTNGSTECPVCHARMALAGAAAGCEGCGSRLS
jgi:hypothetical protein